MAHQIFWKIFHGSSIYAQNTSRPPQKPSIENKVVGIHKNGEKITKKIYYILQFIDSARFMATS